MTYIVEMARDEGATENTTLTGGTQPNGRPSAQTEAMPGIRIVATWESDRSEGRRPKRHVTLDTLDDSLNYTRQFIEMSDARSLAGLLRSIAPEAAQRARALKRVQAEDGVALVDALVEAAILHAGSTVGATVAALLRDGERRVTLDPPDGPRVRARLADGRLVCSFELGPELRWTSDRLLVRMPLAETIKIGLRGKSVHAVVVHPMLPKTTRIASCRSIDGESELRLRSATRVIRRDELT